MPANIALHMPIFAAQNHLLGRFAHVIANFPQITFRIPRQTLNKEDAHVENDVKFHVSIFEANSMRYAARAEEVLLCAVMRGKVSPLRAPAWGSLVDGSRGRRRTALAALSLFHILGRDTKRRKQ